MTTTPLASPLADSKLGEHLLGRRLLCGLLRASVPNAGLLALHSCCTREGAIVRRPFGVQNRVADGLPAPREGLLQLCLVVDVAGQRVLDAARESLDDCALDLLEAVLEEERRQRSLEQGREHVAVLHQPLQLFLRNQLATACLQS